MNSSAISSPRLNTWIMLAYIYVYFAWGATYLALHYALTSLPPFVIAGGRFFIAGSTLLGLAAVVHRKDFRFGSLQEWKDAFIIGVLLLVIGNGGVAWAQQYVTTSIAALIFGSMPLCIIFFDWIRPGGVVPSLRTGIGLAIGFIGLCILIKPSPDSPDTRMEMWGKVSLVIAACSWSAGAIYSRFLHAKGSPLLPMARQMICGGTVLLVISLGEGDWSRLDLSKVTAISWIGFGYLVIFGSLIGFTAYVWLMRVSTAERASTISYVNLVVAVALGWSIARDPMTIHTLAGAGIIVGSVVLVLTNKSTREIVKATPTEA